MDNKFIPYESIDFWGEENSKPYFFVPFRYLRNDEVIFYAFYVPRHDFNFLRDRFHQNDFFSTNFEVFRELKSLSAFEEGVRKIKGFGVESVNNLSIKRALFRALRDYDSAPKDNV